MRKIHESDELPALPNSIYLLIFLSMVFAILSLVLDIRSFFASFGNFAFQKDYYFLWGSIVFSLMGISFGFWAKDKAQNYSIVSNQGCLAEILIYLNFIILAIFFVSLCAMVYIAPLAD